MSLLDLYREQEEEKAREEDFVSEVLVESDLELMFLCCISPMMQNGVLSRVDNMETETEILDFTKRLEDRFGKIPPQGKELIRIVRLRRLAKSLGIEKIVLKNEQMILNLISDTNSPYYNSPAFDKLLWFVQKHARQCRLREVGNKRSVLIQNIQTVESAVATLEEMLAANMTT